MAFEEVKKAFENAIKLLKDAAAMLEKAVGGYLEQPHSKRAELKELVKETGKSIALVAKAAGYKWWKHSWLVKILIGLLIIIVFLGIGTLIAG